MALPIPGQTFNGTTGTDSFTGGGGNDAFNMTADPWTTDHINGGFGWDEINYSASRVGVNITLTDGVNGGPSGGTVTAEFSDSFVLHGTSQSYTIHQTVAELTSIEDATGSSFNDVLNGNSVPNTLDGGHGDDVINGGGGADWIIGGYGRDVLTGGTEGDTFVFTGLDYTRYDFSTPGVLRVIVGETIDTAASLASADVITDFQQGADRIDLRGIDAYINFSDPAARGDQAFNFIGTSQFTGHAGELHDVFLGGAGNTHAVQGDVDGDGSADFSILVQGLDPQAHLNASDFWL
jgi:serralysin